MSAFDDLIGLLRLETSIYHNAKVCGDWQINEHLLGNTCFHIVTSGRCRLEIPEHFNTNFHCGDLVIFPRELAHSMSALDQKTGQQEHLPYSTQKEGTGMLCGEVSILHLYQNQLLDALPPVLFIRNDCEAPWLAPLTELLLAESFINEDGKSETLNRLSEMLFIYALRHSMNIRQTRQGILALYADNKLAKAIKLFHRKLDKKWDIAALAEVAGMSRTSFANHFKSKSGWTVNQYISWWRLQNAWERLQLGGKVSDVSEQVGYLSEAAFSRAFQKHFNTTPGKVRRGLSANLQNLKHSPFDSL